MKRSTADPAAVAAEYAVLWAQLSLRKESTRTVESTVPGGEPCTLPCTLPSFFCYYPELRRRVVQARDGEIVGGGAGGSGDSDGGSGGSSSSSSNSGSGSGSG